MKEYYVYVYLDPNKFGDFSYDDLFFKNEPFYVGKGTRNRCYSGIRDKIKSIKTAKIKSLIDSGSFPIIIKIFENISNEEACILEIKTIEKIGRIDLKTGPLSNLTSGGTGGLGLKHTNEWKKILCKPVLQYKKDLLINEYPSVKEASEKTGLIKQNISSCLTGKYKTTGGFFWKYKNDEDKLQGHLKKDYIMPKHSEETKLKMKESAKRGDDHPAKKKMGKNNPSSRRVIQKSMDGETIKIWDSMQDIKRELGFTPSNICRCCQGSVKRIGRFKWEYYNS